MPAEGKVLQGLFFLKLKAAPDGAALQHLYCKVLRIECQDPGPDAGGTLGVGEGADGIAAVGLDVAQVAHVLYHADAVAPGGSGGSRWWWCRER